MIKKADFRQLNHALKTMSFNPQKFQKKREKTLFTNRGRFDTTQSFDHKIKLKTYNYPTHTRERK